MNQHQLFEFRIFFIKISLVYVCMKLHLSRCVEFSFFFPLEIFIETEIHISILFFTKLWNIFDYLEWTDKLSISLDLGLFPCRKTQMKKWGSSCTTICICKARWENFLIILHSKEENKYTNSPVNIFTCIILIWPSVSGGGPSYALADVSL